MITKQDKRNNNLMIKLIFGVVLVAVFSFIMTYNENLLFISKYFSFFVGIISWFVISLNSQRIINKNLFKKFTLISIGIFLICLVKETLIFYYPLALIFGLSPVFFMVYFRILTYLFFPSYPNYKPKIIFSSEFGHTYYEGEGSGYIPSWKEKLYSLFLFLGFYGIVGIIIVGVS